jgi:Flp pilus assembly pilin Flp
MELFKRLIVEEEGQGLVEYTLMVPISGPGLLGCD